MPAAKTCFLIGPMNPLHLPKLHWLKTQVLEKILEPLGFVVFTPDVNQIGDIMNHVIRSADRADLVVADTTGNNPNVMYEIAILDALGRPCVPIKQLKDQTEESQERFAQRESKNEKMAFDRAKIRYFSFCEMDSKQAIAVLKPVIESALESNEKAEIQENPITAFYGAPLSSMAPTRVMVEGYFDNFILPVLECKPLDFPGYALGKSNLKLEIIIPEKLYLSDRSWIQRLIENQIFHPITCAAHGREVKTFLWDSRFTPDGNPVMVDVPTMLAQLVENVHMRLGFQDPDPESDDYRWLEQDEIKQFVLALNRKRNLNKKQMSVATRLQILHQGDCRKPDLFAV